MMVFCRAGVPMLRLLLCGVMHAAAVKAAGTELAAADDNRVSRGQAVFIDRARGHCLLCHQVSQIDEPFQGNIGPDLSNIGNRLPPEALYQRIADPTEMNPDTAMPAYFRTHKLTQVAQAYVNQPVLSADEMNDLVAFLTTLRTAANPRAPDQ
ncbi:MAG: sulfur oxidation c-type cytochrome SoxX [bacterium]